MRAYLFMLSVALVIAGCDRTTEEPPDGGGRRDTGADVAIDAPEDATTDTPAVDGGEECLGPSGCWSCAPTEPAHFLDGCTDSTCEPFDVTSARLPLLRPDGTLPPLP